MFGLVLFWKILYDITRTGKILSSDQSFFVGYHMCGTLTLCLSINLEEGSK